MRWAAEAETGEAKDGEGTEESGDGGEGESKPGPGASKEEGEEEGIARRFEGRGNRHGYGEM